ncbi:MAG: toxins and related Ca2+-binding domain [Verrucomicrobiota bacterium]|jgi:autotransporter-associated beta strand protein
MKPIRFVRCTSLLKLLTAFAIIALTGGADLFAKTYTWQGGARGGAGTDQTNLFKAGNWSPNGFGDQNADLIFTNANAYSSSVLDFSSSATFNSITFGAGALSFTLTNSTSLLTLNGGTNITDNSTNLETLAVAIALAGESVWNTGAGAQLLVSGNISQVGSTPIGITKIGTGTLTLTGSNSYGGATTINAGTLAIGTNNSIAGAVTVSGGVFSIGAFSDTVGAVTLGSGSITGTTGVLTGSTYSVTNGLISAILGGSGALAKGGAGTVTLSGANTYTGISTVSAGTLALSGGDNRLNVAGSVALSNGATLNLGGFNQTLAGLTGSGSVTNSAGTLILNINGGNNAFGGSIIGAGALNKSGAGTLTLTGSNSYGGATTIIGGTLTINGASAIGTNVITLADATLLSYIGSGVATLNNAIMVGSGGAAIGNLTNSLLTLSGTITNNSTTLNLTLCGGTGGINVTGGIAGGSTNTDLVIGGGTVTLSGSNSYIGTAHVRNGATLNVNSTLPTNNGAGALSLDSTGSGGSTVNLGASQTIASLRGASSSTVNLNSRTLTITNSGTGTVTYAGSISGSGNILKSGAFSQMLTGLSAHGGSTMVTGGSLSLGASGRLTATTNVTVNSGSTLLLGSTLANSINTNAALTLGGGQLSMGAGSTRAFSQTFASLTLTANSSIDFAALSGTSSIYFSNISGLSTYTLSIFNWNGTNLNGQSSATGGASQFTRLYAATEGSFASALGNIRFYSGSTTSSAFMGEGSFSGPSSGGFTQIVPVPEPSVVIAAIMLLAFLIQSFISEARCCHQHREGRF